jgi:hypothetical protein
MPINAMKMVMLKQSQHFALLFCTLGQQSTLCALDHTDMATANATYKSFINVIINSKSSSWHAHVLYIEEYMPLEPLPPKEEFLFYLFFTFLSGLFNNTFCIQTEDLWRLVSICKLNSWKTIITEF